MAFIAIDLGGTKLASAVFAVDGELLLERKQYLNHKTGNEVGEMLAHEVRRLIKECETIGLRVEGIGVSVPGISRQSEGTVWAPNIDGWENYPLFQELNAVAEGIPVIIDSDRACSILGETWKGCAKSCTDAIFIAVGTGIGAGILTGGVILRGAGDIAGCIGWMALEHPYRETYHQCGCFESKASGNGIANFTRTLLVEDPHYNGCLRQIEPALLDAADVFKAFNNDDELAKKVLSDCVELWGMAAANLISLFNPQKIIFGGGVFGPASSFIPDISREAAKWAQPVGMNMVQIESSVLGSRVCLYGAAFLAIQYHKSSNC